MNVAQKNTLAFSYATLLLIDGNKGVNLENLNKIFESCGVAVDPILARVFANVVSKLSVGELNEMLTSSGGSGKSGE